MMRSSMMERRVAPHGCNSSGTPMSSHLIWPINMWPVHSSDLSTPPILVGHLPSDDENKHHKINGDDEAINFRPSPNFKHMRKYLKSKFEEDVQAGFQFASRGAEEEEHELKYSQTIMVQPPLPPHPPPPDSPLKITLKQEVEDDEYQSSQPEQPPTENKPNGAVPNSKESIMCRQFARGVCTRGASCIYAHQLILSQLPGLYTFCKNFQNSGCNFPKCKFVHATVFEKEYFYRTGYLPPHTVAHLKETNAALVPLSHAAPGPSVEGPPMYHNGPLPVQQPLVNGLAAKEGEGRPPVSAGPLGAIGVSAASVLSPRKRDWLELDEMCQKSREYDFGEPLPKKCKNCDLTEFRLQFHKEKVLTLTRAAQETSQMVTVVNKKINRMCALALGMLKNSGKNNNLLKDINIRTDREKDLLNKFYSFMRTNRNASSTNDDVMAKPPSISSVLVRLLLSQGEAESS